ncbi:YggT family protein [Weissella kandleri]|uniref:YggT family protein n=1 Tax=Weissella kandleri TaxID=1616 RepID=UPI00387EBDFD
MLLIFAILRMLIEALELIIVIVAFMSWIPGAAENKFGQTLIQLADIVVEPIRKLLPKTNFLDFSPIFAILLLQAAATGLGVLARVIS